MDKTMKFFVSYIISPQEDGLKGIEFGNEVVEVDVPVTYNTALVREIESDIEAQTSRKRGYKVGVTVLGLNKLTSL